MENNYLAHHGILGMKWGVRRYQNEDGSLTPAGRERYQKGLAKELTKYHKRGASVWRDDEKTLKYGDSNAVRQLISDSKGTAKKYVDARKKWLDKRKEILEKANSDPKFAKKLAKKTAELDVLLREEDAKKLTAKEKNDIYKKWDESINDLLKNDLYKDHILYAYLDSGEDKELERLTKNFLRASRAWDASKEQRVKNVLGKYADRQIDRSNNEYLNNTFGFYANLAAKYELIAASKDQELYDRYFEHSLDEDDHLEHHGILGMKWYRRRFQNEDGSLTPAGRERYGVGEAREGSSDKPKKPGIVERHKQKKEEKRKAAEKAARVKRMQEGKARKAEEKKSAEEHEAAKQKALRSAKASEIMKYRDELTDQEMKDAVARIGWDEALRKKAKEENPDTLTKAMKVVDKYGKAAGSIATATENTTKMYNNIAKALNTFTGSDWPLVGDGKKDQNGSDNKDNTNKSSKSNDDKKPSKKDKENFQKTMNEAAKILGEAAKKVDEESKKQAEKEEKHDWKVDDKPASNGSSSSSSSDKGVVDTKFEYSDAKAERAEQIGRDAVERYLQLEDKNKG